MSFITFLFSCPPAIPLQTNPRPRGKQPSPKPSATKKVPAPAPIPPQQPQKSLENRVVAPRSPSPPKVEAPIAFKEPPLTSTTPVSKKGYVPLPVTSSSESLSPHMFESTSASPRTSSPVKVESLDYPFESNDSKGSESNTISNSDPVCYFENDPLEEEVSRLLKIFTDRTGTQEDQP